MTNMLTLRESETKHTVLSEFINWLFEICNKEEVLLGLVPMPTVMLGLRVVGALICFATLPQTLLIGFFSLALYWWDTTKYFPGVPNKFGPSVASDTGPVILHLGDFDDFSAASSDDIFNKALAGLTAEDAPSTPSASSTPAPIPSDVVVKSGADLNSNFPKYWILDDNSKQNVKNIYYRARDKACQNICDASTIQNVPSQFVRATRVGSTGCEYAIKVSNNKELYFYTTQDGQNCYDATVKIIDTYGDSKDSGWINGPSVGEFYQLGIHDINTKGPGGVSHDDFPADNQHLGFMHLACRRSDGIAELDYDFNLKISGWDDGNWGKSIKTEADKCDKVLGTDHWKYGEENNYKFGDGSAADHWASWTLALTIPQRCGEKAVEKVLGLKEGSVQCPRGNDWKEVDMFST